MSDPTPATEVLCEPWCTDADLPCVTYESDPLAVEQWIMFASEVLYALSGFLYPGPCPVVARPCARRMPGEGRPPRWQGTGRGDRGSCSCNRASRCGCSSLSELDLGPDVVSVEQVRLDGAVVNAAEWELIEGRYLVGWQQPDGTKRTWPCCQRLELPATADQTFEVQFTRGLRPPRGGVLSAASLACELIAANTPGATCRLPKRVTTITRQGVSIAVLDPLTLFAEGRTGLAEVDLWLESQRYGSAHREGVVIVPGASKRYESR